MIQNEIHCGLMDRFAFRNKKTNLISRIGRRAIGFSRISRLWRSAKPHRRQVRQKPNHKTTYQQQQTDGNIRRDGVEEMIRTIHKNLDDYHRQCEKPTPRRHTKLCAASPACVVNANRGNKMPARKLCRATGTYNFVNHGVLAQPNDPLPPLERHGRVRCRAWSGDLAWL